MPENLEHIRPMRVPPLVLWAYVGLMIYGSLFPFAWMPPRQPLFWWLTHLQPHISKADLLANVLVYIPVGTMMIWTRKRHPRRVMVVTATLFGAALSFGVESLQMFLPRESSITDLITNIAGTFAGALFGYMVQLRAGPVEHVVRWRREHFGNGAAEDVALFAMISWIFSQLMPLVPSFDVGSVRHALSFAWHTLRNLSTFEPYRFGEYATAVAGLTLLLSVIARKNTPVLRMAAVAFGGTIVLKPFIVSRVLGLEAFCGMLAGFVIAAPLARTRFNAKASGALVATSFVLAELAPAAGGMHGFNWIPFYGEWVNVLNGFIEILESMWQFVAFAALVLLRREGQVRRRIMWTGAVVITVATSFLEWHQQDVPGRYGDITTILIALGGWVLSWVWAEHNLHHAQAEETAFANAREERS